MLSPRLLEAKITTQLSQCRAVIGVGDARSSAEKLPGSASGIDKGRWNTILARGVGHSGRRDHNI